MTNGEIYFLVIFTVVGIVLLFLPLVIRKISIILDKCEHDWRFDNEWPYSVIYGFGELKCNKCRKNRISWSPIEISLYKCKIINN